jgi:hypothetical protein
MRFIRTNNLPADDQKWLRSFYNYRNLSLHGFHHRAYRAGKGFWNLQDKLGTKQENG